MTPDRDVAARFLVEHAHYAEDLPLWRAVARERGGPVLDLGCAAGRVALPLAQDGHEVWAVDADPDMLAEVAHGAAGLGPEVAMRVRTVLADMTAFRLDTRVRLAIAAMNTLQVLLEPEDRLACLRAVRAHLDDDGGEFWFDVALPDHADIAGSLGLVRAEGHHRDEAGGRTLWHSAWFQDLDTVTGTAAFTHRVEEVADDGCVRQWHRHHVVHLFNPQEVLHLVELAGLRVLQTFGDFAGSPLEAGAERQVYRCGVA